MIKSMLMVTISFLGTFITFLVSVTTPGSFTDYFMIVTDTVIALYGTNLKKKRDIKPSELKNTDSVSLDSITKQLY